MSSDFVFVMKGVSKSINGNVIISDTWLSFLRGAKIGIIGQNGSGKSTLMKIMAGIDQDFDGEASAAKGVKIGYLQQEPVLDESKNVFDNILYSLRDRKKLLDDFNDVSEKICTSSPDEMEQLLHKQSEIQEKIEATNSWNLEHEIEVAMNALCCPEKTRDVVSISGGEKRRVALCSLLLQKPDFLLLDEPTNHLDASSVSWLENYLKNYSGTIVMITHDRYFLDNITQWILEIENKKCIPWHASYSSWLEKKYDKMKDAKNQESLLNKQIKKELKWIRGGRHTKNKARVNSYYNLIEEKKNFAKMTTEQIIIPNGPRLGDLVIQIDSATKKYNDRVLFENFSCRIPPGAIVGIVGTNGSGKSTLLKAITGKIKLDSGTLKIGQTVKLGYIDQEREGLIDEKNVWENISEGIEEIKLGDSTIRSRAYCSCFNFKGDQQQKKIKDLSGGERNRVHLARLLKKGSNVILLDEPSNDLDIETLRNLEEAIESFVGCVIIVSHDRWFLDRLATHIIAFNTELNQLIWFDGNYTDYEKKYKVQESISKKGVRKKISL